MVAVEDSEEAEPVVLDSEDIVEAVLDSMEADVAVLDSEDTVEAVDSVMVADSVVAITADRIGTVVGMVPVLMATMIAIMMPLAA